jgi:CDP-diacylglycerol--glycerol-3-phosphate 3-phosphatidyltransferase
LLVYALLHAELTLAFLVFLAAAGSVLVSYVRARGEALGYSVKGGMLTRVERYLVLGPCCCSICHWSAWPLSPFWRM